MTRRWSGEARDDTIVIMTVDKPVREEETSTMLPSWIVEEISEWIRSEVPSARAEMLRETLDMARKIFGAPRALMVWEEADEPWVNTAYLEGDDLVWKQSAPASYEPVVAERLSYESFHVTAAEGRDEHNPIHPGLREDFRIGSALAIALAGEATPGRLFILDITLDPQHFPSGALVAAIIESRLASLAFQQQQERGEVELRIRSIKRDLHDGLLQSFTGIVLQLETMLPLIESDPEEARRRITEAEGALMNEQRELRSYLESLTEKKAVREIDFDMTGRLRDLAHRYHDQWGVEVEYRRQTLDPLIRTALGWETYRIITEAITNATRHGHAKRVKVTLTTRNDHLIISVEDDGDGFPFRGKLSSDEMIARGVAPTSLTERVRALNGEVLVESTDEGSSVEISIPIGWRQV